MSADFSVPSVEPVDPTSKIGAGKERQTDFLYNKAKMLWFSLGTGAAAIGCGWAALADDNQGLPRQTLLLFVAVLLGFSALVLLKKYFSSISPLTLSSEGVRVSNYSADTIPWRSVLRIEREQTKYSDLIAIYIDRETARKLKPNGMLRWLKSSRTRTKVLVPLKMLQRDPDRIYSIFEDYLAQARQSSPDQSETNENNFKENEVVMAVGGQPIFSYCLILLLVAVYAAEISLGVDPVQGGSPSVQSLFVLGGTFRPVMVDGGQWWRLFTAPLMHASPIHLGLNCYALWQAGRLLERKIGWPWFAAIFFLSAVGGSVASTFLNAPNIVGVGASGGIVGLFAAVIAASFHYPSGPLANALRMGAIQILIPSLLPFLSRPAEGLQIDYSAHLGGAIVGGLLASLLLVIWPRERLHPRFVGLAVLFSGLFVLASAISLLPITIERNEMLYDPMAQFFSGKYQDAANNFDSRATGNENAAYDYLWRYIAQQRGSHPQASADLAADEAKIDSGKWPFPVYSLFLNQIDPTTLLQKAVTSDQQCEATFYSGEWYLMQGSRLEATRRFQSALAMCPKTFMEYEGARGELNLLGVR